MATCKSKWFVPLVSVGLGLVMLAALSIGGQTGPGLVSLGILSAFGALILLGGRSETIRGLRGDGSDERFRQIDLHASAFSGFVVIIAVIVGYLVEAANGRSGAPYTWLGALGGLAYLAAVTFMRARR
jgi:hypothetical protein